MKRLVAVWKDVSASVIRSCWISCGILKDQNDLELRDTAALYVQKEGNHLNEVINQLPCVPGRITIDDLLVADDTKVIEGILDDQMATLIVAEMHHSSKMSDITEEEDVKNALVSLCAQVEII